MKCVWNDVTSSYVKFEDKESMIKPRVRWLVLVENIDRKGAL